MRTDIPHLSEVEVNEVDSSYKERDRCYIKGKEEVSDGEERSNVLVLVI